MFLNFPSINHSTAAATIDLKTTVGLETTSGAAPEVYPDKLAAPDSESTVAIESDTVMTADSDAGATDDHNVELVIALETWVELVAVSTTDSSAARIDLVVSIDSATTINSDTAATISPYAAAAVESNTMAPSDWKEAVDLTAIAFGLYTVAAEWRLLSQLQKRLSA